MIKEGDPLTNYYVIIEGEFELSKQVRIVQGKNDQTRNKFDLKELLPHTEHAFGLNQKNQRFISSVDIFKTRQAFDSVDKIKISRLCPYTLVGLEEGMEEQEASLSTLKCLSSVGKTFTIRREHVEIMLRQKEQVIVTDKMNKIAAQGALKALN